MAGVSTLQADRHKLCLPLSFLWMFALLKLQGFREDPVDLFLIISDGVQSPDLLLQLLLLESQSFENCPPAAG